MQPRKQKGGNWRTKIAVITLNECCSFLSCSLCVTSCITKKYLHRCAQHAIILMEWHVKFKGTRAAWPASRLSCSHSLHGRMHLLGDYLHRLIAVSIRRERRNFFASYKGAAVSEAERKKGRKEKREGKSEQDGRSLSYPIVDRTMEPEILRQKQLFFLCRCKNKTNLIRNYN